MGWGRVFIFMAQTRENKGRSGISMCWQLLTSVSNPRSFHWVAMSRKRPSWSQWSLRKRKFGCVIAPKDGVQQSSRVNRCLGPFRSILKYTLLRHRRARMERTSFILFAKWQEVRVQRQDHAMFSSALKTELWWILAGFFPDPKGCFTMRGRAWESIQAILQRINCHIVLAAISINQSIRVALDLSSWLTLRDVKQSKTRQNFGSLWIWHLASYITWSCNFWAPIKNK